MKRLALLIALLLVAAACNTAAPSESEPIADSTTEPAATRVPAAETVPNTAPAEPGGVASALDDRNDPSFPDPLVDVNQIFSGGPPPDGIPPIDDPKFISVDDADAWLGDDEPVVYVSIDGDNRIYPVQILIWHEIVNDTVAGVPVSVTYCPLCNSAVTYERTIDGQVTSFGTSGSLFNSALVMYDRLTESLWTHYDGKAVVGHLVGAELEPVPSPLLSWADAKEQFPEAQILDRDQTGHRRSYGTNPYAGYDNPTGIPFLFRGSADDRAELMQRVVGVTIDESAVAWPLHALQNDSASATPGSVGDTDLVIFWKAGQSTALETDGVGTGRDVGSVGVFKPEIDGRALTFDTGDGTFRDEETGSTWSITGAAIDGELAGSQLEQVPHLDSFWFAWSSYQPNTELVE